MNTVWWIDYAIALVLLWFMAYQDFKTTYVSGISCALLWCCTAVFVGIDIVSDVLLWEFKFGFCAALGVIYLLNLEFALLGDADIAVIALFLGASFNVEKTVPLVLACGGILVALPFYIYLCEKKTGIKWKPFTGQMMPAVPLFALAWVWFGTVMLMLYGGPVVRWEKVAQSARMWYGLTKYSVIPLYTLFFMLGSCMGSAINCAVWRRLHGISWVHGRSRCVHCGHQLQWFELIPVISCLSSRARCRICKKRFGYFHAIFELLTGLMFTVDLSTEITIGASACLANLVVHLILCIAVSTIHNIIAE